MVPEENKELTYWEKAVGLTFNPSNNPSVDHIKRQYATIIDFLDWLRKSSDNAEYKRLLSIAITEAQTAQMWAVKAITYQF